MGVGTGTGERGFAVIPVLAMVSVLAAAAAGLSREARHILAEARTAEAAARARALAEAGVARAAHDLVAADAGRVPALAARGHLAWAPGGMVHRLDLPGGEVRVSIVDEGGLVDLNAAPPPLLKGLLVAVGVEAERAAALADAVADWRDEDSLHRLNGAEAPAYRRAGRRWGPGNRPFRRIEELRLVLGVTEALYRRLEPLVTVYGHRPEVDVDRAPRAVLMAVPRLAARAEAILALRPERPAFSEARTFRIRAEARAGGATFVRVAILRLTGEARRPARVLEWRAGRPR